MSLRFGADFVCVGLGGIADAIGFLQSPGVQVIDVGPYFGRVRLCGFDVGGELGAALGSVSLLVRPAFGK